MLEGGKKKKKAKAREAVSLLIDDKGNKNQRDEALHNSLIFLSLFSLMHPKLQMGSSHV